MGATRPRSAFLNSNQRLNMKQSYPKWLYHKTEAPKIVQSKEEHEKLGKGWEETPAAFDKKQDAKAEKPASVPTKDGSDAGSSENPPAPETEADQLNALTVKQLQDLLIERGKVKKKTELKGLDKAALIEMVGKA